MRRQLVSSIWLRFVTAAAAAALVVLAVTAPVGAAAAATLVKDINPTGDSNPTGMTQVGNTLFFAADDGIHGVELWKSDGSATGTRMVKDIRPLGKSSNPSNLVNVNGTLFFTANDGTHRNQLWKSNGTKAGTVRVSDVVNHTYNSSYGLEMAAAPVAVGSRLFFFNLQCCMGTSDLYVSNGTEAGTKVVSDPDNLTLMLPSDSPTAAAFNGKFYFVAYPQFESQATVWVSDGTVAGTHKFAGSPTAEEITILPASGQNLYFYTGRLWKTDGTAVGTKPLTTAGQLTHSPDQAVLMGTKLYFSDGYLALWRTNGTASGTKEVSPGDVSDLTTAGGRLYFTRGYSGDLWKSDGTAAGTTDMGKFGAQWPESLIAVGGTLCFTEVDWDGGTWTLWESDGTVPGTYEARSFVGVGENWVPQQTAMGSKLFFAADDGTHGVELWSYAP